MFATGIENSIPTIDNGRTRVDQMEASDHYRRWRRISTALRIWDPFSGPPLHKTFRSRPVRLGILRPDDE